jgi:serpin B
MSGRRYLTLVAVGLTLLIAAFTVGQEPTTARDSQGDVRRDAGPDVGPAAIGELVAGNNAFAFDLFHAIPQGEGNLLFSPYGISTALAMTYAGARGETAEQMADVLHYTLPQAQLHPALNALNQQLTATDDGEGFELTLANALWGQEDGEFRQEYLDSLAADYGARMRLVDFQSETGRRAAGERINRWVSDATAGRIPDLVDPLLFTQLTRLVLTNAITFDGLWEVPFDDTQNAIFRPSDDSVVIIRLMQRRALTPYASGENWQAAELCYQGGRAHMLILLPAEGRFEEFARDLDAARVGEIAAALTPTDLALYLPRFAYAADLTLPEVLSKMGMTLAFSAGEADFSGMVKIPPRLWISQVLHKAYVSVDEQGTEAAAGTAVETVVGAESSMPAEVMLADRPFLFLIRDTEQGTILFLGRLVNPAAS